MIFDFISGEASTQEGGEKFAKWLAEDADLTQKEKKSVVEKIKDFFTKLLDAVRSVIEGQGTLNTTARAGQKAAQQVPVLDDFFNALDNAINNRQRMLDGDTAQKNSTGEKTGADVRFSIDPEFEKKYDQWDGSDPRVTFFLGTTGRALKKAGMVNQKIYFDASKILKIKNKHPEITDRVIIQIPSVLQNPIVIMKSKDPKNKPRKFKGYTIFGELYVGNNPVLVVLGADVYGRNGMKLDGVKVVSTYRISNGQSFMDSSDVVFVTKNKERISMWEGRTGLRLPVGDSSTNSPDTTISQTGSSVNTHSMQNGQKNAQNGKDNTQHSLETDSPDIRYSKRVGFDHALTPAEWKKYNSLVSTDNRSGLRISDNAFLVEGEKGENNYKLVFFDNSFDDKPITAVYGIGDSGFHFDKTQFDAKKVAEVINKVEEKSYDDKKIVRGILRHLSESYGLVLTRYGDRDTRGFTLRPRSNENVKTGGEEFAGRRITGQDTRVAGELTESRKSKEITDQYKAAENTGTKYSYAELTAKPDMPITKIDDTVQYVPNAESRKHIVNQAIENAKRVGTTNEDGNAVIHVADIDTDVVVSKKAIKHSLDRRLSVNAPVVQQAGEILSNAVQINELVPRKASIEKANVLVGMAKNAQNEPYVVSFIVNKHTKELQSIDVLYAVNAKTEPTGSLSPQVSTPATGSNISIANLLDYVNRYFPDMLSESVLRQYGYTARPEGEIGKSALYSKSIDDTGRTSLLRDDKRLDEMNITLRQVFDSQELETGHHTSQTQVQRVARQLKKSTGSKMDTPRLMVQLKGLFDYIGNNEDVTFSSVMDQAKEIAHELLDSTPEHTVRDEYAQEVLDTLRGMAITLSDEQKAETAYHHDRYGNDLLFLYFASKRTAISTATP